MVVRIKTKQLFYQLLFIVILSQFWSYSAAEDSVDCSLSNINFVDNPEMTRAERIEAMNRAFFDSLNRFEECTLSTNTMDSSASSASSANAANAAAGSDSLTGTEASGTEEGLASESIENPLVSGTEPEATAVAESLETEDTDLTSVAKSEQAGYTVNTAGKMSGAAPEDIPEANNDDVVAAQIRLAAEIEKDPEKKARLWNEYRKYKGLPVVKNEEL